MAAGSGEAQKENAEKYFYILRRFHAAIFLNQNSRHSLNG
jgi:hypothetical protein